MSGEAGGGMSAKPKLGARPYGYGEDPRSHLGKANADLSRSLVMHYN